MPTEHRNTNGAPDLGSHGDPPPKPAPVATATVDSEAALDNLARLFDLLARILGRTRPVMSTDPALDGSGTTEVS